MVRPSALLAEAARSSVRAAAIIKKAVAHGGQITVEVREKAETVASPSSATSQRSFADPQTAADRSAEVEILTRLRQAFPGLRIVGEESSYAQKAEEGELEVDPALKLPDDFDDGTKETLAMLEQRADQEDEVDLCRVAVFVDPLDGTKSFVRGNVEAVSTLIGVCVDDQPVGGVINLVFRNILLVGGHCTGGKVWKVEQDGVSEIDPARWQAGKVVVSSSRSAGLVNETIERIAELKLCSQEVVRASGSGNKFAMVILGEAAHYIFPRGGTSKWDTAGGTALLLALGGKVCNRFGEPLQHVATDSSKDFENIKGFVASRNPTECDEICKNVTANLDITKIQDGSQISSSFLREKLGINGISAFRSPARSAIRQKHCVAGRLELLDADFNVIKQVFFKRVAPSILPKRPASKWRRDLASYLNEANFYRFVASEIDKKFFVLPEIFHAEEHLGNRKASCMRPEDVLDLPLETIENEIVGTAFFSVFAQDLSKEYVHKEFLQEADLIRCTEAMKLFQQPGENIKRSVSRIWSAGTYWEWSKRPEGEVATLLACWANAFENVFQEECASLQQVHGFPDLATLGERLHFYAKQISDEVAKLPLQTLVHGDLKTHNIFFHKETNDIKLIDFQWSGLGHPYHDLVYLLLSSAELRVLESIGGKGFHSGGPAERIWQSFSASRALEFDSRAWRLAILDYARAVIAYQWGVELSREKIENGKGVLSKCSHNKSPIYAKEFIRIVEESLELVESASNL